VNSRPRRSGMKSRNPKSKIQNPKSVVVCRCEEVTESEIRDVIRRGYHHLEEIKRILRCGMGHCQGRSCLMIIARVLSQETGIAIKDMTFPTSRPPLKPVPLELLGGHAGATDTQAPEKSQ
jgi:bacterioferritin-associated ferredoxin